MGRERAVTDPPFIFVGGDSRAEPLLSERETWEGTWHPCQQSLSFSEGLSPRRNRHARRDVFSATARVRDLCSASWSPSRERQGSNRSFLDALSTTSSPSSGHGEDSRSEESNGAEEGRLHQGGGEIVVEAAAARSPRAAGKRKREEAAKASRQETIYSIANVLVGAGMLSVPYGFVAAGWAALLVLFGVLLLLTFTALLIGRVFDAMAEEFDRCMIPASARDFATLAHFAFGRHGRAVIGFAFVMEVWMASEAFLVMVGINANLLTGISKSWAIAASGLASLALFYAPLRFLARLSMVSVFSIAGTVLALLWSGASLPSGGFGGALPSFWSYHAVLAPEGLLPALGLCLFCLAGHPCLPSIYWNMRDTSEFPTACVAGFALAAGFYGAVACIGYYFYGDRLAQSFTENLGTDLEGESLPGLAFLKYLAAASFVVKIQGMLPMVFGPVVTVLESLLLPGEDAASRQGAWLWSLVLRSVLVAVSVLAALRCQDVLNAVCGLCGCGLVMATSVVFPCAVYFRLMPEKTAPMKVLLVSVCLLGTAFGIKGTMDAVLQATSRLS